MVRDRRAKFVELAQNRVNKAISHIRLIGNLANRTNYEFDDEDAKKIVRALQKELDALRAKFGDNGGSSSAEFKL
jgi:ABC-type Fe3+-hydroxamate transport system substrate-binding protein